MSDAPLEFADDFGKGLDNWPWRCGEQRIAIDHRLRRPVVRFRSTPERPRSEIMLPVETTHLGPVAGTVWYAWRMSVPADYRPSEAMQVVGQWHDVWGPLDGSGGNPFVAVPPPLRLELFGRSLRMVRTAIEQHPAGGWSWRSQVLAVAPLAFGHWSRVVVAAGWSRGAAGLTRIWLDGRYRGELTGANLYNDRGNLLKIGLYLSASRTPREVAYTDVVISRSALV